MKALSIKQPYANLIYEGKKTLEIRSWRTPYRGDILIVASKNPKIDGLPTSGALCIVNLTDCRPMRREDERLACCDYQSGSWAWVLENVRPVEFFRVSGRLGIYEVPLPKTPSSLL